MKKRFAVSTVLMSTALVLGTTTAWAETSTGESTAKITFTINGAPIVVDPIDPKPENEYKPGEGENPIFNGNTGPLTLDYASNFNFGSHDSADKKTTFKSIDQKPFIQVTDRRSVKDIWRLSVKLGAFTNEDSSKKTLTNAKLTIKQGTVQTLVGLENKFAPKNSEVSLNAGGDAGIILTSVADTVSTWQVYWDKDPGTTPLNSNISLDVPLNAQIEGTHTATLEWTLTDAVN
ncbi:WxL domain-containing protein [Exiguobacterium acetylicum]|uniref:WxL domain-containing protein n=1 Tax=Exiguobacterium acetylicum TaxID=41170 RepID=UPI003977DCDA